MPDVPDTGTPTRDTRAPDTDPGAAVVGYARLTGLLGIVFAVLLTIGLVLIHRSPALDVSEFLAELASGDGATAGGAGQVHPGAG